MNKQEDIHNFCLKIVPLIVENVTLTIDGHLNIKSIVPLTKPWVGIKIRGFTNKTVCGIHGDRKDKDYRRPKRILKCSSLKRGMTKMI